jgi:hypothetical protein
MLYELGSFRFGLTNLLLVEMARKILEFATVLDAAFFSFYTCI